MGIVAAIQTPPVSLDSLAGVSLAAERIETILYAEADMAETLYAKRTFDVVGHYGRADLFGLTLRGSALIKGNSS